MGIYLLFNIWEFVLIICYCGAWTIQRLGSGLRQGVTLKMELRDAGIKMDIFSAESCVNLYR